MGCMYGCESFPDLDSKCVVCVALPHVSKSRQTLLETAPTVADADRSAVETYVQILESLATAKVGRAGFTRKQQECLLAGFCDGMNTARVRAGKGD